MITTATVSTHGIPGGLRSRPRILRRIFSACRSRIHCEIGGHLPGSRMPWRVLHRLPDGSPGKPLRHRLAFRFRGCRNGGDERGAASSASRTAGIRFVPDALRSARTPSNASISGLHGIAVNAMPFLWENRHRRGQPTFQPYSRKAGKWSGRQDLNLRPPHPQVGGKVTSCLLSYFVSSFGLERGVA